MPTDIFPLERFLKTAAMLASGNENERSTAAKMATAMLEAAGLDWTSVLRKGLGPIATAPAPGRDRFGEAADSFTDLFSHLRKKATEATASASRAARGKAAPSPRPHGPLTILQGEDIPNFVRGTVIIREKRLYEAGKYLLVFGLANVDRGEQYDPLVCFKADSITLLEQAAAAGTILGGRVRNPTAQNRLPEFMLTEV